MATFTDIVLPVAGYQTGIRLAQPRSDVTLFMKR